MNRDPVDILWTGGFDSTFRICQLLIDEQRDVQPVYGVQMGFQDDVIVDLYDEPNHIQKPAMPHEMQAIENIRLSLERDFPAARARLRPIRFVPSRTHSEDWTEDTKIRGPGINKGRQYDLLRMVAERYGRPIELCIERSLPGHNQVGDSLMPWVEEVDGVWRLREDLPAALLDPADTAGLVNFARFRFPVLHTTRAEMMEIAGRGSYQHILRQTWSCREYRPSRRPCGECFCCLGRQRDGVFWDDPLGVGEQRLDTWVA